MSKKKKTIQTLLLKVKQEAEVGHIKLNKRLDSLEQLIEKERKLGGHEQ